MKGQLFSNLDGKPDSCWTEKQLEEAHEVRFMVPREVQIHPGSAWNIDRTLTLIEPDLWNDF